MKVEYYQYKIGVLKHNIKHNLPEEAKIIFKLLSEETDVAERYCEYVDSCIYQLPNYIKYDDVEIKDFYHNGVYIYVEDVECNIEELNELAKQYLDMIEKVVKEIRLLERSINEIDKHDLNALFFKTRMENCALTIDRINKHITKNKIN